MHEKACDLGEGPFSSFNNDQEAFKNVCSLKEARMIRRHWGANSTAAVVQYFHKLEMNFI